MKKLKKTAGNPKSSGWSTYKIGLQAGCRIPATCPPGFQGRYTVVSGDTMWLIAQRFGVTLNALIAANPHIADPNQIVPCDVLCVPDVAVSPNGRVPVTCPPGFQGRYTVVSGDTMWLIAQRFGVTLNALIAANPHITNPNLIFPGDVLCVPVVVPPDGRVPVTCPPGFQGRYTVVSGDTMFLIAQRFGVTLNALIAANPHITNPDLIFPGDVLCVPEPPVPDEGRVPVTCPPGFRGRYTVEPGDTMFAIAQQCGVSLQALINANPHISDPNQIFPCDVLCVPCPQPGRVPQTCPTGFRAQYTVRPGDSMFSIAQLFGVGLQALINANLHITDPNKIFPCDVLCVPCVPVGVAPCFPVDVGRVPVTCPPGFQGRYTVVAGDTMFAIAQRFGVSLQLLIVANPHITDPNLIFPGDVLCVPDVDVPPEGRVPVTCPPGFRGRYTVVAGDTMSAIAQRFGVCLQALIDANPHITDPDQIFPCDVLCVPCPQPGRVPQICPTGFQGQYTVQPVDSMFSIAQRFGVGLQALINANPHITDPNKVFPCDVLCVPCP